MRWLRQIGRWSWTGLRALLYASFAAVCALGLHHAFTASGPAIDPGAELRRARTQLAEARALGQELSERVAAFDARRDVRMQMIRAELGMLRASERIYLLK